MAVAETWYDCCWPMVCVEDGQVQAIAYQELVPFLIESVKALKSELDASKSRIQELEDLVRQSSPPCQLSDQSAPQPADAGVDTASLLVVIRDMAARLQRLEDEKTASNGR
eukprot:EC790179.1.p1 GENE.EC790179.1~~EC790179.1.p1  ORF type:complete len:111 (-),score=27.14 EC790179.1:94-426(-)